MFAGTSSSRLPRVFGGSHLEPAYFPAGRMGIAVGDIHGCARLLGKLFDVLEKGGSQVRRQRPVVIFLGDYIDRGPDSRTVIELLLNPPDGYEYRFLMGNHERSLLRFLDNPVAGAEWLLHGGVQTLASYGVPASMGLAGPDALYDVGRALRERLPPAHKAFFEALELFIVLGDYVFVRAGVDASRTLEEQKEEHLLWARKKFLESTKPFSHKIVHGHTPAPEPYLDTRRVGVDTGAYFSGILSAACLYENEVSFLSVRETDGGGFPTAF